MFFFFGVATCKQRIVWPSSYEGRANAQRAIAFSSSALMRLRISLMPLKRDPNWSKTLFFSWHGLMPGRGMGHNSGLPSLHAVNFFSWGSTWKEYVLKLCLVYLHTELTKLVWLINALGRKIPNLQNWERLLTPFVSSYTILWLSRCPASYMQQTWLLNFCFTVVVSMFSSFLSVLWFH